MKRGAWIALAIAVAVVGFAAAESMFTVHQTQQALLLQFGKPQRVITEPGLNFKIPFIQQVEYLEKRILSFDAPAEEVIASDQKRLIVDSFARFRIIDPLKFYQRLRTLNAARSRLASMINSSLRRVLGKVDLQTTVSGERSELMKRIRDFVNAEALDFGIEIVDVRLKRTDLPEANSQAIYRRMRTEREREAKEYRAQGSEAAQRIRAEADRQRVVLVAEAKRKSEILRGEGDGERTRIFAEAFSKDPGFFAFYRSLQAYRKALGRDDTTMVLSPDSEFFRYFKEMGDVTGE